MVVWLNLFCIILNRLQVTRQIFKSGHSVIICMNGGEAFGTTIANLRV